MTSLSIGGYIAIAVVPLLLLATWLVILYRSAGK